MQELGQRSLHTRDRLVLLFLLGFESEGRLQLAVSVSFHIVQCVQHILNWTVLIVSYIEQLIL